jgi:hypothetical protein
MTVSYINNNGTEGGINPYIKISQYAIPTLPPVSNSTVSTGGLSMTYLGIIFGAGGFLIIAVILSIAFACYCYYKKKHFSEIKDIRKKKLNS